MKTLIFEPRCTGHHLSFIKHISPSIRQQSDDLIFVTSRVALESNLYAMNIDEGLFGEIDASCEPLPYDSLLKRSRLIYNALVLAIKKYEPRRVFMPSADDLVPHLAINPNALRNRLTREVEFELGCLYTTPSNALPTKRRIVATLKTLLLRRYRNVHLYLIDPFSFRFVIDRRILPREMVSVVPDPVEPYETKTKINARAKLGLPLEQKIVGIAGAIGSHPKKGVLELLQAFEGLRRNDVALLLAGRLSSDLEELLETRYSSMLRSGQLLLLNRFLDQSEMGDAISSMDVVFSLYRGHYTSSGIVMIAARLNRPVVAPNHGWFKEMVNQIPLGWLTDSPSLTTAELDSIVDRKWGHRESGRLNRFLEYSSPENFGQLWTRRMALWDRGLKVNPRTWDWVIEGRG